MRLQLYNQVLSLRASASSYLCIQETTVHKQPHIIALSICSIAILEQREKKKKKRTEKLVKHLKHRWSAREPSILSHKLNISLNLEIKT